MHFIMLRNKIFLILLCFLFMGLLTSSYAWQDDGVPVFKYLSGNGSSAPRIVSDGVGGSIICWVHSLPNDNLFSQRVNSNGSTLWTLPTQRGVSISSVSGSQYLHQMISDDTGGGIIAWVDTRNGNSDIYAQRVNGNGSTLWTLDGQAICTANGTQFLPQLVSDGSSGAIITWYDGRNTDYDIYAQRINSDGSTLWTSGGIPISTVTGNQMNPQIITDGSGGAILTWEDTRYPFNTNIYAQRINGDGSTLWALDGIEISSVSGNESDPQLTSDGANGAIIAWVDIRVGIPVQHDIYAQRVNSNGSTLWTLNGVAVVTAKNRQKAPRLISDGANGAIITWEDFRSTTGNLSQGSDLYAQRLDGSGASLWTADGIVISDALQNQSYQQIIPDESGGAYITWEDSRNTTGNPTQGTDIYAQRIDSSGSNLFAANGVVICDFTTNQIRPQLVYDGSSTVFITWADLRNGLYNDIWAQSLYSDGHVPVAISRFESVIEP